jgi:small GTP-binding protein
VNKNLYWVKIFNKNGEKTHMEQFTFKIPVVGDGTVGKTSLIKKFTKGGFEENYVQTIGAQFSKHQETVDGDLCKLFFWDIAGQDTFHFLRPTFYQGTNAAIVVYSLEENKFGKESFNHVKTWRNEIRKYCGDIPVILFGNKVDLINKKKVGSDKGKKLVKKGEFVDYFQTSAKTGELVIEAFHTLINDLHNKYKLTSSIQLS